MCDRNPDAAELVRLASAALESRLSQMIALLCNHACLRDCTLPFLPVPADKLRAIALKAVTAAVPLWDRTGDWIRFAVESAVAAIWNVVQRAFISSARQIVSDYLKDRNLPPSARIDEVVASICAIAPRRWLMKSGELHAWNTFVHDNAEEHLLHIGAVPAETKVAWNISKTLHKAIVRMAMKLSKMGDGSLDEPLCGELVNVAMERVAHARRSHDPKLGLWKHYALRTAKNAMRACLDPRRRHDWVAIWLLIEDAREAVRYRKKGGEPTIEEIMEELDPPEHRLARETPKYSRTMIRRLMILFRSGRDDAFMDPELTDGIAKCESLFALAKLTDREKEVLSLWLARTSHAEIAERVGIGEGRARTIKHEAIKKLQKVAMPLTAREWEVMKWVCGEEKSHFQVAKALGISKGESLVLLHCAAEKLRIFPDLHAPLSEPEWQVLNLSLRGMSHEEIAARSGRTEMEVVSLLGDAIETLTPPPSEQTPQP